MIIIIITLKISFRFYSFTKCGMMLLYTRCTIFYFFRLEAANFLHKVHFLGAYFDIWMRYLLCMSLVVFKGCNQIYYKIIGWYINVLNVHKLVILKRYLRKLFLLFSSSLEPITIIICFIWPIKFVCEFTEFFRVVSCIFSSLLLCWSEERNFFVMPTSIQ